MTEQSHAVTSTDAGHAPPGWYQDPQVPGAQRYWDGAAWTEHRAPGGAPAEASMHAPRKRRLSTGAIVGITLGGVAALIVVLGLVAAIIIPLVISSNSTPGEAIDADVPEGWTEVTTMEGAGTFSRDPQWEDISDYMGMNTATATTITDTGIDIVIEGAWKLTGDLETGFSWLYVASVADTGGPSSAQIEAEAFVRDATQSIDNVEVTSKRAVRTDSGLSGYIIEFTFRLYDVAVTDAIGVIVDGERQFLVFADGSEAIGTGIDELETVMNSLTLD